MPASLRLLAEALDHLPPVARLGPLAAPVATVEREPMLPARRSSRIRVARKGRKLDELRVRPVRGSRAAVRTRRLCPGHEGA
jgi:hypothetical protein